MTYHFLVYMMLKDIYKEVENKAKKDNIDLEITSFQDKREYNAYDCTKIKYTIDRWHINVKK